jgi:SAM-dependent methyltransferase
MYDRYRLDYPDDVVDAVLRYAGRPVCSAVEVGAGTGKATRLFASRGIAVTAVEPDPGMARVLTRNVGGLPVVHVLATFEQFVTERRFDLLYAAAAWHWTDPATRWTRTIDLLVPGGVVALFGRPGELLDPDLAAAVDEIEKGVLPDDGAGGVHPWSIEEIADVDGLTDGVQLDLPADVVTTTATDYVGRLATVSAYLTLDPLVRSETLRKVRALLPEHVETDNRVRVSLARRARPDEAEVAS